MKNLTLVTVYLIISYSLYAQLENQWNDYIPKYEELIIKSSSNSEYGRDFTPRGPIKFLFIFVNFDNPNEPNPNNDFWPADQDYPNWFSDGTYVFDELSDFDNIPVDNYGLSRYFYEMSKLLPENDRFKIYGGYLSVNIEINILTDDSWPDLAVKAYAELETKYSNISEILQQYDNRENGPAYRYDNRNTSPDSIVDYAIMVFRYNSTWEESENPYPEMEEWWCSHGAWADIPNHNFGSIAITDGYTHPPGLSKLGKTFTHELSHCIFDAPHYGNCNRVVGKYFSSNTMWGIMPTNGNEILGCANAWERWYLGYINIKYDLDGVSDNGNYILRDYMTTGDAIRIKLPYVTDEYLWLENHQGLNVFDNRIDYKDEICGYDLPDEPTDLMIYVEKISSSKTNVGSNIFYDGANGLKLINADGNYDYSIQKFENRGEWCGNEIPQCTKGIPNPYSGYHTASRHQYDRDSEGVSDGIIDWHTGANGGTNEHHYQIWIGDEFLYGNMGPNSGFRVGQKIGISTNPAITNFQEYNKDLAKLTPTYLNGISIEVLSKNTNGDLTIQVEFDNYDLNENIRMCGDIVLPPETINLSENKTLTLDKSGTPNRYTLRNGKFINPTEVSTSTNTIVNLNANSAINVKNESVYKLSANSSMVINDNALFTIKNGTTLLLKSNSGITIKGSGRIEVEQGGYICIEDNATIDLQDELSVINLHSGYISGVNTDVITESTNCIADPSTATFSGNGHINNFGTDVYVQNEILSSDTYYAGQNIYAGEAVTSQQTQGPVIIQSGAEVILDADGDVVLDEGFELAEGGIFEIR